MGFLTAWGSVDFWTRAADKCYRMCRDDRSEYVVIPSGRKHFFGELYRRESFCALRRIPFGDREYTCTADVDGYMTRLYGDYRTAPPADRQERHVFFTFKL